MTADAYLGCKECAPLVGIDVSVWTKKGAKEFAPEQHYDDIPPDDYGGPNGQKAACFELFSMRDLAKAALSLGFRVPDRNYADEDGEYEGWEEFMDDFGLKWIQAAAQLCRTRHESRNKEVK